MNEINEKEKYHCPYCSRNGLKGERGLGAHIRQSHSDKEYPSKPENYLDKESKEVNEEWQKKTPRRRGLDRTQKIKKKVQEWRKGIEKKAQK